MRALRSTTVAVAAAALTLSLGVAAAGAPGGGQGEGQDRAVARHAAATTAPEQAAVRAHWTPELMRNAIPREQALRENKGKPGGGGSSGKAVEVAPESELGKVFFTLGGSDYVCSGTATASANGDVVTTAGHCLNEGPGAYATNFMFAPAYDDGATPYGRWVAESLVAPAAWV